MQPQDSQDASPEVLALSRSLRGLEPDTSSAASYEPSPEVLELSKSLRTSWEPPKAPAPDTREQPGFTGSLKGALASQVGGIGAVGRLAHIPGAGTLADWGSNYEKNNYAPANDLATTEAWNSPAHAWESAKEVAGMGVGYVAPAILSGGASALAKGAGLTAGAIRAIGAGTAAAGFGVPMAGNVLQAQKEAGIEGEEWKALPAGVIGAALGPTVGAGKGVLNRYGARALTEGLTKEAAAKAVAEHVAAKEAAQGLGSRMLQTGAEQAATMPAFTAAQRWGTNQDLMSPEAVHQYAGAAIMGGMTGLAAGAIHPRSAPKDLIEKPGKKETPGAIQDMFGGEEHQPNIYDAALADANQQVYQNSLAQGELFPQTQNLDVGYGGIGGVYGRPGKKTVAAQTTTMPKAGAEAPAEAPAETPVTPEVPKTAADAWKQNNPDVPYKDFNETYQTSYTEAFNNHLKENTPESEAALVDTEDRLRSVANAKKAWVDAGGRPGTFTLWANDKASSTPETLVTRLHDQINDESYKGNTPIEAINAAYEHLKEYEPNEKAAEALAPEAQPKETTTEGVNHAIQEPGTRGLLQQEPEGAGVQGGERGRVEPVQQGPEAAQARKASEAVGAEAKRSGPVTDAEGNVIAQGKPFVEAKADTRDGKGENVAASFKAVATDPIPEPGASDAEIYKYITSGVDQKHLLALSVMRGEGDMSAASQRTTAEALGVSAPTAAKYAKKALADMKANALKAELDWNRVEKILQIEVERATEAAPETGFADNERVNVVRPDSDEFDATHGMTREETAGEELGAEPVVEHAADADIAHEELLTKSADATERALDDVNPEVLSIAGKVWKEITGKSFNELTADQRVRYADMILEAGKDVRNMDDFEKFRQNAHDAFTKEHGLGDQNESRTEAKDAGVDATAANGGEEPQGEGIITGAQKDRGAVKVSVKKSRKYSEAEGVVENPHTKDTLDTSLKKLMFSKSGMDKLVTVYHTQEDAVAANPDMRVASEEGKKISAFTTSDGKIGMIAEHISKGQEIGKFLHEVGGHLGMEKLVGKENMGWLDSRLNDWAGRDDGSKEAEAAKAAIARSKESTTDDNAEGRIAYTIEELSDRGITPQAMGISDGHLWFRKLWAAAKIALRKIGFKNPDATFTGQHLIDLAYGAAHLETEGSWHGTAKDNIRFSEKSDAEKALADAQARLNNAKGVSPNRADALTQEVKRRQDHLTALKAENKIKFSEATKAFDDSTSDKAVKYTTDRLPEVMREPAIKIVEMAKTAVGKWKGAAFGGELTKAAKKYLKAAPDLYEANIRKSALARELSEPAEDHGYAAAKLSGDEYRSANSIIDKMDSGKKWAYSPDWDKSAVVDPELKAAYDGLSQKTQDFVANHFKLGHDSLQTRADMLRSKAQETLTESVAAAEGNKKLVDAANSAHAKTLKSIQESAIHPGPYSPQVRSGDYFVSAKSKEYASLDAKVNRDTATTEERARYDELRTDPKHFWLSRADRGDAEIMRRKLESHPDFEGGTAEKFPAEEFLKNYEAPLAQIEKLKNMVRSADSDEISEPNKKAIVGNLNELYLNYLSSDSAKHAAQRREGIAGYDPDRISSAIEHYKKLAHLNALLETSGDIHTAVADIRTQAHKGFYLDADGKEVALAGDRETRKEYANELLLRNALSMMPSRVHWEGRAMQLTAGWKVVTSPSFYMQTFLEPFQVALPQIAAKHGYGSSLSEMWKASREAFNVVKMSGEDNRITPEKYSSPNGVEETGRLRDALRYLYDRNRLTLGHTGTDYGETGVSGMASRVFNKLGRIATNMEAVNRVTTALTAYRLDYAKELAKGVDSATAHENAKAYTDDVTRFTHGEYEEAATPRYLMSGNTKLPIKMITQFKRFQLMQFSQLVKNIHDTFGDATPEEKAIASKALKYSFTQYGVLTGAFGMPMFGLASTLVDWLFKDKGEALDPEMHTMQFLSKHVGPEMAKLLSTGASGSMGVPLHNKIGAGEIGQFVQPDKLDISNKGKVNDLIVSALGPFVGFVSNDMLGAVAKLRQGDYYKGMEGLMPTGVKNAMQTYRLNTEGMTNAKNDILMTPEDMTFFDKQLRLAGINTSRMELRQMVDSYKNAEKDSYQERYARLSHEYASAFRSKDRAAAAGLKADWLELQQSQRNAGFIPTSLALLYAGPKAQLTREAKTTGGVQWDKNTKRMVSTGVAME